MSTTTQEEIAAIHKKPHNADHLEVRALCEKIFKLQAEVKRLSEAGKNIVEEVAKLRARWDSVLAEVGDEPVFTGLGYETYGDEMAQRADHYKARAEHLAAKLVKE